MLWHWLLHDVFDLDRGLLLTVRELVVRPGAMIRSYIAGQRHRQANPLTYLFITSGLSLLAQSVLGDPFSGARRAMLAQSVARLGHYSEAQKARWVELSMALVPYTPQLALAMCVFFVIGLRVLFRKSGYNLAEICVFGLFTTGQVYLYYAVISFALFFVIHSYTVQIAETFLLYPIVYTQAAFGFFGGRVGTAFKVLLAWSLSFLCYSLLQSWLIRAIVLMTTS
jgi:hypothetical protein